MSSFSHVDFIDVCQDCLEVRKYTHVISYVSCISGCFKVTERFVQTLTETCLKTEVDNLVSVRIQVLMKPVDG